MKTILNFFLAILISTNIIAQAEYQGHYMMGGEGQNPQTLFNGYFATESSFDVMNNHIVQASYCDTDTIDIDPNPTSDYFIVLNTAYLASTIIKTDTGGNFEWVVAIPFTDFDSFFITRAVKINPITEAVVITGILFGSVDMNPSTGSNIISSPYANNYTAFIAQYDANGNFEWAHTFGGLESSGEQLEFNDNNNVIVVGTNNNGGDLNPDAGMSNNFGGGFKDFFIAEFNATGDYLNGMSWGSTTTGNECNVTDLLKLNNGNFLIQGWAHMGSNLNPTGTIVNPIDGIVIIELDQNLNFIHGQNILNRPNGDFDNDIVEDNLGNKYFSMRFNNIVDIDPTSAINNATSNGVEDHVIMKFTDDYTFVWSRLIGGDLSADFKINLGVNLIDELIVFGSYEGSIDLDLNAGTNIITTYNGTTARELFCAIYDENSNLVWGERMSMIGGTIGNPLMEMDGTTMYIKVGVAITNLDEFDLAFGPTVQLLNFTQSEFELNAKYSFCPTPGTSNTAINVASDLTLTAQQTGDAYQWVDCDNGNAPISGATNQSYTPTQDGNYACEISLGYCSYLSECKSVSGVGLNENEQTKILIYPNPTSGNLTIYTSETNLISIKIFDMQGNLVLSQNMNSSSCSVELTNGVYMIQLENTKNEIYFEKVIVQ